MNKCKREVREADTAPTLGVKTPEEKLATFEEEPGSHSSVEFCQFLQYSAAEISHIEKATVGQSSNPHWIAMRKQVLTASTFKTVCHSVDLQKTAQSIVAPRSLDEKCLPAPLQYGRKNEKKSKGALYNKPSRELRITSFYLTFLWKLSYLYQEVKITMF